MWSIVATGVAASYFFDAGCWLWAFAVSIGLGTAITHIEVVRDVRDAKEKIEAVDASVRNDQTA